MSNLRTRQEIEAVIKQAAAVIEFVQYKMPGLASFLTGKNAAYLANGIGSSPTMGPGGTGYTATVFTVPLPATAPNGSVPAVITFTNTAGVLSAPVVTTPGSGYGTAGFNWVPSDGTGSGASVSINAANPDQAYNFTPTQVGFLQYFLGLDFAQLGALLSGTIGGNTASAVTINAPGTLYVVNDTIIGPYGLRLNVSSVGGGGAVTGVTINIGGVNAAVATGIATTTTGAGSGFTFNITAVALYDWYANTLAWAGWGF